MAARARNQKCSRCTRSIWSINSSRTNAPASGKAISQTAGRDAAAGLTLPSRVREDRLSSTRPFTIPLALDLLRGLPAPPDCYHPYASGDAPRDAIRLANLRLYLEELAARRPRAALVGEAPGIHGCHWSGVPFAGERLLARGLPRHGLFGPGRGYRWTSGNPLGESEASGTILWGIIEELPAPPFVWNAFPLHPHPPGRPAGNRTPRPEELRACAHVLPLMLSLFPVGRVVAVGRKAEGLLAELGIPAQAVRHPANGGAPACREGLLRLLGEGAGA
jgi:uracil-DNA glycosylase